MTPTLLSAERLREAFLVLEDGISEDDRLEVGQEVLSHIAALETDNAALLLVATPYLQCQCGRVSAAHDAAGRAVEKLRDGYGQVWGEGAVLCAAFVPRDTHPGAHLLAEHAKALVRARNEGMEKCAVAWAAVRRHGEAPPTAGDMRAMKEPESDSPAKVTT